MRACTRCSEGGLTCTRAGLIANLGRSAAHRVLTGDQRSGSGGGRGVAGAGRRGSRLRNSCARALPRPPTRRFEHALQRASMNILARARQHHRSASQRHGPRVRPLVVNAQEMLRKCSGGVRKCYRGPPDPLCRFVTSSMEPLLSSCTGLLLQEASGLWWRIAAEQKRL